MKTILVSGVLIALLMAATARAADMTIKIHLTDATAKEIGTVTTADSPYGLLLTPHLTDLAPGLHGFHVHEQPSCEHAMKDGQMTPGLAAGGHLDPAHTGRHEGPYGKGHLGDLPALFVAPDGRATLPVLAPRLKVADLKGHALMIHAGGDNYADQPEPLGGGGARLACGVVK